MNRLVYILLCSLPFIETTPDITEAQQTKYNVSFEEIGNRRAFVRQIRSRLKEIQETLTAPRAVEQTERIRKQVSSNSYIFHNLIFSAPI